MIVFNLIAGIKTSVSLCPSVNICDTSAPRVSMEQLKTSVSLYSSVSLCDTSTLRVADLCKPL